MFGKEDEARLAGASRKTYLRSASWTDRSLSPAKPNPNPRLQPPNCKARSCLPPLQPLSITRRSAEEWPRAGSDDLGIWPNPQTPRGSVKPSQKSDIEHPAREFQFKKDKLAFFDKECSRILDHIYLGSDAVAKNRDVLRQNGITNVLNCVGFVCPEYFKRDFVYKTLWLQDSPSEDITSVLYDVFDYFEEVLEQGGRVFVHCCQGVSRSTSLVIAYLMWREGQSFEDAFQYVKAARGVANPNMGFACQLLQCQKRVHAVPASPNSILRMYRMAPHSPYDPLHLVPKMLNSPSSKGLDSRGAFVIHVPSVIYVWMGKNCNSIMFDMAREAASQLIRYERAKGPIVNIKEGDEPGEFWDALVCGPVSEDGCDKVKIEKEETLCIEEDKVGERKVNEYDSDFEIFYKALSGGIVPNFSVSTSGSENCLPARENGWGKVRRKFANMKELVTSSKVIYTTTTSPSDVSDMHADIRNESERPVSLVDASSPSLSPTSDLCDSSDMNADIHEEAEEPLSSIDPSSPSASPPLSPTSFLCDSPYSVHFSTRSPNQINSTSTEVDDTQPLLSPTCIPSSPDSSCFSGNSPNFGSKSPALSPSTSDYSSSFTFSPSSSNWSDLSYLSSQQPSPSGLESTEPISDKNYLLADNSFLHYKNISHLPAESFPTNPTLKIANYYFPLKGSLPSIAERRGSNPPVLMLVPSIEEPREVQRNIIRSTSFSLPDLDDDVMEEHGDEIMVDIERADACNELKGDIEDEKECGRINNASSDVNCPVLFHWPSMNKVEVEGFVKLDSRSAYVLWAPDGSLDKNTPGVVFVWFGLGVLHDEWKVLGHNFIEHMGLSRHVVIEIIKEGEETEQFKKHLSCLSSENTN